MSRRYKWAIMSKRRTRKEKKEAHHSFTISWKPEAKNASFKADVNRQIGNDKKTEELKNLKKESVVILALNSDLASIRKNIFKSLIFATLILGSEIVLYLLTK